MPQLAVIDRPAAKGRFRHIGLAAEFGNLAQDLVVLHRTWVGTGWWAGGGWRGCPTIICPPRECGCLPLITTTPTRRAMRFDACGSTAGQLSALSPLSR